MQGDGGAGIHGDGTFFLLGKMMRYISSHLVSSEQSEAPRVWSSFSCSSVMMPSETGALIPQGMSARWWLLSASGSGKCSKHRGQKLLGEWWR